MLKADSSKIRRWREERHWSQEHLAELAGISLRTVQRIENGDPASRESLMALGAAFNVDVSALCFNQEEQAMSMLQQRNEKTRAGLRLSFWINLASYICGAIVFVGISVGVGGDYFVMYWPLLWWTVGVVAHGAVVVIVEAVTRYQDRFGE